MVLRQTGATLTGTYQYRGGTIQGALMGRRFVGTWRQTGSSGPCSFGRLELLAAPDCRSYAGHWQYCAGNGATRGGNIAGAHL
jgi:hypothetical protein